MVSKILITEKEDFYVIKDIAQDYHCTHGFIRADVLQSAKNGEELTTSKGVKAYLSDVTFADRFGKIKRGAQIITAKDAGIILATTLVDKDSVCVDAGTGSGALSCFLARYTKQVYSYDIKPAHVEIGQKNADMLGMTNVEFAEHNIYDGLDHTGLDLITLDVPEPWQVLDHATKALKSGAWLVCYVPCINQIHALINAVEERTDFHVVKNIEMVERNWQVKGKSLRPKTHASIHTGFLSFLRKI